MLHTEFKKAQEAFDRSKLNLNFRLKLAESKPSTQALLDKSGDEKVELLLRQIQNQQETIDAMRKEAAENP